MEVFPAKFFGVAYDGYTPFMPSVCEAYFGDYNIKLTPKRVARVVKAYMITFWGVGATKQAIKNATVEYNADFVHKFTPWNNPRLRV